MKKLPIILSAVSLALTIALGVVVLSKCCCTKEAPEATQAEPANAGTIVYFSLERVMLEYQGYIDKMGAFETKAKSVEQEITRRQTKLEKEYNTLQEQYDKGLLTNSSLQVKAEKLNKQRDEFQQYVGNKQNDLAQENQTIMNTIANDINDFVASYNETKGFAMILSTQGDILPAPVVCANEMLDITDDLIAGLNAAYTK